jgi:hypothetical protein
LRRGKWSGLSNIASIGWPRSKRGIDARHAAIWPLTHWRLWMNVGPVRRKVGTVAKCVWVAKFEKNCDNQSVNSNSCHWADLPKRLIKNIV